MMSILDRIPRPGPLDRLGLITLLSSLYFMQVWGITAVGSGWPWGLHMVMVLVSIVGVCLPGRREILMLNAIVFCAYFLYNSPIASNNQTTGFFFSSAVILALIGRGLGTNDGETRDGLFRAIAGPGRFILAGMYFYGIYHKINVDFFDPAVSCAVELYRPLAGMINLQDWVVGHHTAIWATFFIEGVAMIALFIPRLKWLGFVIGVPFHVIIGFTGYSYYKDFSTIVLVLYALFLTRDGVSATVSQVQAALGGAGNAARWSRFGLFSFVVIYLISEIPSHLPMVPADGPFMPFFGVYSALFYVFAIISTPRELPIESPYRLNWRYIVPVLFMLNGASPYLGLKTEGSIAMYSNLHIEAGETNHFIGGVLPFGAGYSTDVVTPIRSNSAGFDRQYVGEGMAIVRYALDRDLALYPDLVVEVQTPEGPKRTDEDWTNTYLSSSWLAKKFLLFKPVDFGRPKLCTH